MAYGFNGGGDVLIVSANMPVRPLVLMAWFILDSDTNAYQTFIGVGGSGGQASYILDTYSDGTTFNMWNGTGDVNGSALTVGRWYHGAIAILGTGAGEQLAFLNGELDITTGGSPNVNQIVIGDLQSSGGEPLNGRMAAIKGFASSDLTSVSVVRRLIRREMVQYEPVVNTGCFMFSPGRYSSEFAINYNSNDLWTVSGTVTELAGPPHLPWVVPPRRVSYFIPSGGILYQETRNSSITPTSVLIKGVNKVRSSAITPTSIIVKTVSKSRSPAITPTSALFIVISKVRLSTITPASSLVKLSSKVLSSSVPIASTISKLSSKSFSGTVPVVSALVKVGSKVLNGTVTPVSSLVTSAIRVVVRSSTITPVSALVKTINKNLNNTVPVTSMVVKVCEKVLSGSVPVVSSLVRVISKIHVATITPVSAIIPSAIKVVVRNSVITPVSGLVKVVNKSVSDAVTPVSTLGKVVHKALSGVITPVSTFAKMYLQYVVHTSTITPVSAIVTLFVAGSGFIANNTWVIFRRRKR